MTAHLFDLRCCLPHALHVDRYYSLNAPPSCSRLCECQTTNDRTKEDPPLDLLSRSLLGLCQPSSPLALASQRSPDALVHDMACIATVNFASQLYLALSIP